MEKGGFTLVELMVVIVIVGVLAAVAIPNYNIQMERTRAAEGVQSLTALLNSQERYRLENGAYAAGPTLTAIDVDIAQSNNFNAPTIANNAAAVASITRRNAPTIYTLSISSAGAVSCNSGTAGYCAQIGF